MGTTLSVDHKALLCCSWSFGPLKSGFQNVNPCHSLKGPIVCSFNSIISRH